MAPWPSGKAKVCNTSIPSSILGGASNARDTIGCPFCVGGATTHTNSAPHAAGVAEPVRICRAERVELDRKRQASKYSPKAKFWIKDLKSNLAHRVINKLIKINKEKANPVRNIQSAGGTLKFWVAPPKIPFT